MKSDIPTYSEPTDIENRLQALEQAVGEFVSAESSNVHDAPEEMEESPNYFGGDDFDFPWKVGLTLDDGVYYVTCSGGMANGYLAGSKLTSKVYSATSFVSAYSSGAHVYVEYTHATSAGASAAFGANILYGTIPSNSKDKLYVKIAQTVNDVGGNPSIQQYVSSKVVVEDAHRGQIVMQATGTTIPEFWQICDGTNGTPDMTDKFPRGGTDAGANNLHGGDGGGSTNNHSDHGSQMTDVVTNVSGYLGGSEVVMNITTEQIEYLIPPETGSQHSETSNVPEHVELQFVMRL